MCASLTACTRKLVPVPRVQKSALNLLLELELLMFMSLMVVWTWVLMIKGCFLAEDLASVSSNPIVTNNHNYSSRESSTLFWHVDMNWLDILSSISIPWVLQRQVDLSFRPACPSFTCLCKILHTFLFQLTGLREVEVAQILVPTWQLTALCNFSSRIPHLQHQCIFFFFFKKDLVGWLIG